MIGARAPWRDPQSAIARKLIPANHSTVFVMTKLCIEFSAFFHMLKGKAQMLLLGFCRHWQDISYHINNISFE